MAGQGDPKPMRCAMDGDSCVIEDVA